MGAASSGCAPGSNSGCCTGVGDMEHPQLVVSVACGGEIYDISLNKRATCKWVLEQVNLQRKARGQGGQLLCLYE